MSNKINGGGIFSRNTQKESEILENIQNKTYPLHLNSYQLYPAFYLKHLKPEQKGLLVNHLMGTGKTFTGLNFINEFKIYKPYVICPEYLINTWNIEKNKLNLDIDIEYIGMNEVIKFIDRDIDYKNSILVIDEGHNLINKIRNEYNEDTMHKLYTNFKKYNKILFLTGTSFYQDEYDIIYIMNLVSGEDLLPFNKQLFEDKFFTTSKIKSGFYGWMNKILNNPLPSLAFIMVHFGLVIDGFITHGNAALSDSSIYRGGPTIAEQDINIRDKIITDTNRYSYTEFINPETGYRNYEVFNKTTGFKEMGLSLGASNADYDIDVLNKRENSIGYKYLKSFLDKFGVKMPGMYESWVVPIILSVSVMGLILVLLIITELFNRFNLNKLKTLDSKKIGKVIKDYISIYKIEETRVILKELKVKKCHSDSDNYFLNHFCESYLNDLYKSDFPSRELFVNTIEYNEAQMDLFMRACYNRLTPYDIYDLGISKTIDNSKLFNSLDNDQFLNYGRAISNLTLRINNNDIVPAKFEKILKISGNKQTVIYSNFYEKGLILFAKYLKEENKKFNFIIPSQTYQEQQKILLNFKDKKYQYLLLHPDFTEGLSIIGANQLHILEPLLNYSKFEQLQYRVIRKNSHTHLPVKERKVEIYLWVSKVYSIFKHMIAKYDAWKKFSPQVIFWKKLTSFDEDLSPDSIILERQNRTQELYNEFNESINQYSIETCYNKNNNFKCDLPIQFKKVIQYESKLNKKGGAIFGPSKKDIKNVTEKINTIKYNIDLKPYQLFPTYYLKNIEPSQKGLLINHLMGTGKTFTGLHFLNTYKEYNLYVICPEYLINTWKSENEKLGSNLNISFYTYNNIDAFLNIKSFVDSIIVFDEGHNFIYELRNNYNEDEQSKIYKKLYEFEKILFLTGTPFYQDEFDIIYIINLVSGKTLLPFNKKIFEDKYFDTSVIKSGFFGWLNPIIGNKFLSMTFLLAHFSLFISGLTMWNMNKNNARITEMTITDIQDNGSRGWFINPITGKWERHSGTINPGNQDEYNLIVDATGKDVADTYMYKNVAVDYYKKILSLFGINLTNDDLYSGKATNPTIEMLYGITPVLLVITLGIISKLASNFNLNKVKTLNADKLGKDINKYISAFDNNLDDTVLFNNLKKKICHNENSYGITNSFCRSYLSILEVSDFPQHELIIKNTRYNNLQSDIFIRLCYERLSIEDVELLGITSKEKSKYIDKLSNDDFLNYGRVISNLLLKQDDKILIPDKFLEIIKISFEKQTVIYSNFYEKGLLLFAKFLKDNNLKFKILIPNLQTNEQNKILDGFKNKEYQYLLLHPVFTEGLSVIGANQLHILEPLNNYAKFEQLQYRVIRKNSHTHLPLKERKVSIYQWITKSKSYLPLFIDKIKAWKKFSKQVVYWERLKTYDEDLSPDTLVIKKNDEINNLYIDFKKVLNQYSIENCSKDNKKFICDLPLSINQYIKKNK